MFNTIEEKVVYDPKTNYSLPDFVSATVSDYLLRGFYPTSEGSKSSKEMVRNRLDLEIPVPSQVKREHDTLTKFILNDLVENLNSENEFESSMKFVLKKETIPYSNFGIAVCIPRKAEETIRKKSFESDVPESSTPFPIMDKAEITTKKGVLILSMGSFDKSETEPYRFSDIVYFESAFPVRKVDSYTKTIIKMRTQNGERLIWFCSHNLENTPFKDTTPGTHKKYLIRASAVRLTNEAGNETAINRVIVEDVWNEDEPTDELLEEKEMLKILRFEPWYIFKILNPTDKMLETAIKKDPWITKYLGELSDELKELAVEKSPPLIAFIKNPSGTLQANTFKEFPCLEKQMENVHPAIDLMSM